MVKWADIARGGRADTTLREAERPMNSNGAMRLFLLALAGCGLAACNDEGMKYVSGPEDPSLLVTSKDLEEVNRLLQEQQKKDIAAGLRAPAPVPAAAVESGEMPAGHPPVGAAAGSGAPAAGSAVAQTGGTVNLQVLEGELPEGWTARPPTSQMRLAEILIPAAAGDAEDGMIAVFPEIGGGLQANIDRWYKQITQPDGRATKDLAKVEFLTAESGLDITLVDVSGTYDASTMMAKAEPQANWRLLGAIVKAPTGLIFLKGAGPEKTMAAQREAMIGFLRTLRLPGSGDGAKRVETHGSVAGTEAAIPPSMVPEPASAAAASEAGALELGVVTGTLPAGWSSRPPSSSMRIAEILMPAAAGDPEGGELVVFFFGAGQGGSVEDNLQRWTGQIQGGPPPTRESFYAGGMPVTMIDATGTYTATSMRPDAPPSTAKDQYRMLGAVVESPGGSVFFKAAGPERTMGEQREKFVELLKSLKPKL